MCVSVCVCVCVGGGGGGVNGCVFLTLKNCVVYIYIGSAV